MYKDILDKIVWSFSTLSLYDNCPYAFYEKKVARDEIAESSYYAEAGSYIHSVTEMILNGALNIDNAIDYFIDNYDNNVVYTTKESTMEKKYNEAIDYLAAFDTDRLNGYEILGVEKKVSFEIDGYKFIGFIDLLLRDKKTGQIFIVDHKSSGHFLGKNGKPLKSQLHNFENYRRQMYLYCCAVKEKYGEFPGKIIWNHFYEQTTTVIPFVKEEYDEALKWAVDTIHRIYNDTEFDANVSFFYCNTLCDYRSVCEYKNQEQE